MIFQDPLFWVVFIAALIFWLPQNVIHEGSHAIFLKAFGYDITAFKPYLHKGTDGRWRFAAVYYRWQGSPDDVPSNWKRAFSLIAPVLTNTLFLIILIPLLILTTGILHGILGGLAITNFADAVNNWRLVIFKKDTGQETSDVWRFSYYLDVNPWWLRIGGLIWIIGTAAFLFIPYL